ncbi:MAG: ArnT family glycosyltransferase [Anaerolineales bacterium]
MNDVGWIVAAVAGAVLLDGILIWAWRGRKVGLSLSLSSLRSSRTLDRSVLLAAVAIFGALLILIGQLTEPQYTPLVLGLRLFPGLIGLALFAGSGLFFLMSKGLDKPAQRKKTPRKKKARQEKLLDAPNLELVAMLLGSGLLLFIGRALSRYLDASEVIIAQGYTALGLGLSVLVALSFGRKQLLVRLSRWLQMAADWLDVSKAQIILLTLAPLLALAAWLAAGDGRLMRQPQLAVLLWLLGILFLVAGSLTHMPAPGERLRPRREWVIVAAVFLGAFLLRGIATAEFPWLLTGDEASGGLSALEFVNGERNNIFGLAWFSFPALYFYLQSISIRLFGQTTEALRLTSALAGALTVLALYWFLKQAFGRWVALAGSILLAASHFHIHFSRLGLNNIWDGFFVAFISGAFWWGWSKNNRLGYVLAGLGFGLAQYFYASSRILILLFPLWLAVAAFRDWDAVRARLNQLAIMALSVLVITLPLALYYLGHLPDFYAPMSRVSYLGETLRLDVAATGKTPAELLASQFVTSALAFTSANLRYWYIPGTPMLLPLSATLFLMGVVLLLLNFRKPIELWLILWLAGAITIGALSESTPAAQRYVFAAPAVAATTALALVRIGQWLIQSWPTARPVVVSVLGIVVAAAVWGDLSFYFGDFSGSKRFGDLNTETASAVARMLNEREPGVEVYFFGGRMGYYSHSSIPYLAPDAYGQDVLQPLTSPPNWELSGPTVFVFLPERAAEMALVQERYPGGEVFQEAGRDAELYLAYELPSD